MSDYFSDRELGKKQPKLEEISVSLWNGIIALFEEYKRNNFFSFSFPDYCYDNNTLIIGFNEQVFNDRVKAEIPTIEIPISRKEITSNYDWGIDEQNSENENYVDKYSALDFIEFLCRNFKTPEKKDYHKFFQHYHLDFVDNIEEKKEFISKLNQLFERNEIVYQIGESCQVTRKTPIEYSELLREYKTDDEILNQLIDDALKKITSTRIEERKIALEKIWDAFERMKTYYKELKKKQSIEQLLEIATNGQASLKDELSKEARELTRIGNEYQIRHFETDKKEINQSEFIDYLFFRMLIFINMIISKLEK